MQSTLSLFRHLYQHLPPLFPKSQAALMGQALDRIENDQTISLEEVEVIMIKFGYELWPYNQALKEYLAHVEERLGEHFLLPTLSPQLHQKYLDYKKLGGGLKELHSGKSAHFFTPEERQELCEKLVDLQKHIREFAEREIAHDQHPRYIKRIREFQNVLAEIRHHLDDLRFLAEREEDHPTLANEIRSRIRSFEHGLCLLGPDLDYQAVYSSVEFFKGRKEELNRLKGAHTPIEIDFYQ
jgi:DNA mismatch repair ATPase MutS